MRTSIAAAALIREVHPNETRWLAQWNPRWGRYHLVGGHKHPSESFRECLVREIGEELGLFEGVDFVAPQAPAAHLEFTAFSEGCQQQTAYTMELFEVQLCGTARQKIDAEDKNRWLTEAEIQAGQTADGKPVSATMQMLLAKIG